MTLAELQAQRYVHGHPILTLEGLLEIWPPKLHLNLELKAGPLALQDAVLALVDAVAQRRGTACEHIIYSSFDPRLLSGLKQRAPTSSVALLLGVGSPSWLYVDGGQSLGCDSIHLDEALCSQARVESYLRRGFVLGTWGARTRERERTLAEMGISRIISDLIGERILGG
jgi:glycerophosphoryl diester phosphodiesterase